jgi:hypothetical protein
MALPNLITSVDLGFNPLKDLSYLIKLPRLTNILDAFSSFADQV